ncbi:MAG: bifunctional hydroxymethylpyrimidine kinase/phosphomethylpyrimidine kinase [Methanothermobacter sp.]
MTVLSIAGFDPSGGAGILNDIKTFHALKEYGTAVITALTAQNVKRVDSILPVDVDFIKKQIDTILEEEKIVYAKTGMLYSPEIIKAVADRVEEYQLKVVVDPVMIAGSGGLLSGDDLSKSLKKYLLPLAELTTPNIYEAQTLSGISIRSEEDAIEAAYNIGEICNVVITGGHLNGNDVLYNDGSIDIFEDDLMESENVHGSGCTYSSACTVYLHKGYKLEETVLKAGIFTKNSIKTGLKGTLNQFWSPE